LHLLIDLGYHLLNLFFLFLVFDFAGVEKVFVLLLRLEHLVSCFVEDFIRTLAMEVVIIVSFLSVIKVKVGTISSKVVVIKFLVEVVRQVLFVDECLSVIRWFCFLR
jgi:hypothetical protein